MKNKNILIVLLLILIVLTFFILWLKNIYKLTAIEQEIIAPKITNSPNIAIDSSNLPNIKTIDTNTGKNIFQGVAYGIQINKTTNSVDLFISNKPSHVSYYLSAKLQNIQILNSSGVLKKAIWDDLQEGSVFKIIGGQVKGTGDFRSLPIENFEQIILLSKPKLGIKENFTGSFTGSGSIGREFILDNNQGLKINKGVNNNPNFIIIIEPQKYYLKLENMEEALLLPNNYSGQNIPYAGKSIISGVAICPIENYPCFIKSNEVSILALRDKNPNDKFNVKGKLSYRFNRGDESNILLKIPKADGSFSDSKFLHINSSTKIYSYNNNYKQNISFDEYKTMGFSNLDKPADQLTTTVEAKGTFICPQLADIASGAKTLIDCHYVVDTLIFKNN